ncbi:MAG: hypothetical protein GY772_01970 [bacterium]|nr:hypothetical protein [bacterium]
MSADQTNDALALLDALKDQADRLHEASCEILDAISAAEEALLDDDVDPDADRCDLIGAELGQICGAGNEAEGAALDIRDLLGD